MDIRLFLAGLTVSHGPNDSGEYMCKCPAHEDRTASLSVREGDGGKILLHCMAGCSTSEVVRAMGLKMADLFPEDSRKPQQARKPQPKPQQPAAPAAAPQAKPDKPLGKMVQAYKYTDEAGKLLFEVCRFEHVADGVKTKTFRQRHIDPQHPKAKRDGYVWNLDGVRSVVYRLPEVVQAIQDKKTVYVVEGEKDADTLAALGFCATTNPGGASKQGTSKWLPEHTEQLTGAIAVILPDNDAAGLNDRQQVAAKLATVCESVKLLDLKKACPTLPAKGDITDMLEIMGKVEGIKALQTLEADTQPVDTSAAQATAARDAAAAIINNLPGYCVHEGCISQWSEDTPKRLCTFTAIASGIVMRDAGVTEEKNYTIDGWTREGHPLPRVRVPAKAYKRMDWLTESWDIRANILPGTTATEKVRYVIEEAGYSVASRTVEYTHTGWRKIGGKWAYLYRGGAIGADGITVDLGTALDDYCLDERYQQPDDESSDLLTATLVPEILPRRIGVPLVAFAFLAPLREALLQAGFPPAFSLYLVGGTGTRKSTVSALMLSYFGHFTALSLPASFNDTANYVRKKAFDLKDMVIAVDDYHPEGNLQARKKMEDMAQQLSRAFGDLAQRGRMNADRTVQGSMPPRALALISGEDMPNIRDSGEARYYVINIGKGDIPADEVMTHMQDQAAAGTLAHLMRRYIEWLAPQMDTLPAQLGDRFKELRSKAQTLNVGHSRAPGTIAHLLIGYEMYMRFLIETGVYEGVSPEYFKNEMGRAIDDIVANAKQQGEESRSERPSRMYLATIGELLLTKEATVVDLTDTVAGSQTSAKGHIGYMDANYYYFLPETSYTAVCSVYTKKGEAFPLTMRMLHKQLDEDGLITTDTTGGKRTRNKSINGKAVRLLWVPRSNLDGPRVVNEQLRIDTSRPLENQGFAAVDDEDVPFK